MKIVFKEEQKFTQWWLWLILIGIGVLPIIGIYKQLIIEEKFGDNPMSDLGLIIFSIFIFGLITLFWFMRLKTIIDQNEIRMSFFPFVKKKVNWKDVKSAEVVNYGFVGGWGIRLGTKYGTVYNIKGNRGLAIELLNGKKFLTGTQKETELREILAKIKK
ncbi:phosphoethanolamine transferase domain-containing protein [Aequorivita sinensis]|uniref:phosphoethanolamine transferase domain-containing protein n=2 Tax=Flavobacteriaceae TaxID=49546 RepID=UPI001FE736ED|nr:phosphoethanolamine transferase domain-containing protein [Aequorivita sinensis]